MTQMATEHAPTVSIYPLMTNGPGPAAASVADDVTIAEVVRVTEEIFGVVPTMEMMIDPEDPAETPFLVFTVQGRGSNEELIQRHILWGERLRPLNMDLSLRLSIIPIS
jgi:hypothetical protein